MQRSGSAIRSIRRPRSARWSRQEHQARVLGYIARGRKEGARNRSRRRQGADRAGYFVAPTVFDNVKPRDAIAREEIFGPVLGVITVAASRRR